MAAPSLTETDAARGRAVPDWVLAGLLTLSAAALRFWALGEKALWLDEAVSLRIVRHPLGAVWANVQQDTHPPLFYLLLHLAWRTLGDGEAALRSVSAAAGTLVVPFAYGVGRMAGGRRVGALTGLLVALSPFQVYYAQEARMYALLALAGAATMWGLARLLADPEAAARPPWRGDPAAWAAYAGGMAAALLTHTAALFLWAGANLVVGAWWAIRRRLPARLAVNWVGAQAAVLAVWGLWLPSLVGQARRVGGRFWLGDPNAADLLDAFRSFSAAFGPTSWVTDLFVFTLLAAGVWHLRSRPVWAAFGVILALAGPVGELLASLWVPVFLSRTLIWAVLPFLLLAAAGAAGLRWRSARWVAVGALVVLQAAGLHAYATSVEKGAWREAAALVAERARPEDLVVLNAYYVHTPFDYYFRRHGGASPAVGVRVAEPPPPEGLDVPVEPVVRLPELVAGRRRVWLVYGHEWFSDPDRVLEGRLEELGRPVEERVAEGIVDVRVVLFDLSW